MVKRADEDAQLPEGVTSGRIFGTCQWDFLEIRNELNFWNLWNKIEFLEFNSGKGIIVTDSQLQWLPPRQQQQKSVHFDNQIDKAY